MTEKLESNPDAQKHFDALFTKVGELIKSMGKRRNELSSTDWNSLLKQLDQKILKAENIRTVEGLKKFIQGRDIFSDEENKGLADGFLSGGHYKTEAGELIYQLSPNGAIKLLSEALLHATTDQAIELTEFVSKHFEYLKNAKDINVLLHNLSLRNPGTMFFGFKKFVKTKDSFDLLKWTVARIGDMDEALLGGFLDEHLDSLGLSKTEKDQILVMAESKKQRLKLMKEIVGSGVQNKPRDLLWDVAVTDIDKIKSEWIDQYLKEYIPKLDEKIVSRWKSMIARNLFFQKKDITQENVTGEIERIIKTRKEIGNVPLFQGKNILFAANIQKDESGENNFGKNTVLESLKKQGGKVDFQRPESTEKDILLQKKDEVLDKFSRTPPPFVFIFDGHGLSDGIYFSGGQSPSVRGDDVLQVGISAEELIDAYKKRLENFPILKTASTSERDCLIFNSCFGHDFLRYFYAGLPDEINKPITISAAEFGQVGYMDNKNGYENDFFEKTLDLANPNGTTTFENVFQGDEKEEASNPSLYVPDGNNKPMHLSQNTGEANGDMV